MSTYIDPIKETGLRNLDRAMAYAKQKGVEIPDINALQKRGVSELQTKVFHLGGSFKAKDTRKTLAETIVLLTILPQLTPAQRKRLQPKDGAPRFKGQKRRTVEKGLRNKFLNDLYAP